MNASPIPAPLGFDPPAAGRRAVGGWLLACCALVFAMVVVGGVTRLTHSGLSIVEWQPLVGALPPLTDAQWAETFAKYQLTPEYRLRNHDMTVEGFKGIFWWEYFHRLLGRLIGLAFLVPFLYFWARGRLDRPLAWRLAGIFVLGGLQGAMGWYMVKSGLVDDPRVSQFRLTAHLGLALAIHAAMLWVAVGLLGGGSRAVGTGLRRAGAAFAALVFALALTGGLVAGIRAGKAYNTFPLMNGHWIPPEILMIDPWWLNFGYNMATVQFVHRTLALAALALALALAWRVLRAREPSGGARAAAGVLAAAAIAQVGLGIATVLAAVPVALGAAHQGGAVVVLSTAVWLARARFARARGRSPLRRSAARRRAQHLARDEARQRRDQVAHGVREFLGLAEAPGRDRGERLPPLRLGEVLGGCRRAHEGGGDRVHGHAAAGAFAREGVGERGEGAGGHDFRGAAGRHGARRPAHVHDAAPAARGHLRHRGAGPEEGPVQGGGEHATPGFLRRFARLHGGGGPGGVHEDVHRPELAAHPLVGRAHGAGIGHVAGQDELLPAQEAREPVQPQGIDVDEREARAFLQQQARGREAQGARRPGHHRHLAVERHRVRSLACRRLARGPSPGFALRTL